MQCYLRSSDVPAGRPETFGERAHEHVDVLGVAAEVVHDALAVLACGTDAVGFVQIEVGFVFFFQGDHFGQAHDAALHAVDALDDYEHFAPRFVVAGRLVGLAITDMFT